MAERFYSRDREANGLFLTAVLSTGIYCLPSCTAKKPLRENLRFYPDVSGARRGGFRACLRCRPDEWRPGASADVERIHRIVSAVARDPASFTGVDALARIAGVKRSRLSEMFRVHLQESPASWLRRERIFAAADKIARSSRPIFDIALDYGFASSSTFHSAFLQTFAITPMQLRHTAAEIIFHLPRGFRTDLFLRSIASDPNHPSERVADDSFRIAARDRKGSFVIDGRFRGDELLATFDASAVVERLKVVKYLSRRLRLPDNPRTFERGAGMEFSRMIGIRTGMRTAVLSSPFDALLWAIVGQAISRSVASKLRRSIAELVGDELGTDFFAPPSPQSMLRLEEKQLVGIGLTGAKARTLLSVAAAIDSGELSLEVMRSAEEIRERLVRFVGIGKWTIEYVLLRGYGFADVVPLGDAALRAAVSRWKHHGELVNDADIASALERFRGHRSLAVEHLWHWNDEEKAKI